MKESVVDIHDLQEAAPFFKSRFGSFLGKVLIKWLSIDKVNKAHAHNCHLRGAKFTTALLNDPLIDIKYDLHNAEVLDHLPEGAFATVSNHPIGSIDGIMLIDIFASRRPDFKVMVNGVLTKIGTHSVIRLIRKAKVPVYPVYFDFLNSRFFYWLGRIDWRIRTLRIPAEAFNKRGRTVDVYIGEPVSPEEIQNIANDKDLAEFLYQRTYAAKK